MTSRDEEMHGNAPSLTSEQIRRLADLFAEGRCDFPQDLRPADLAVFQQAVRARLRERLVRWIAQALASYLESSTPQSRGPHV